MSVSVWSHHLYQWYNTHTIYDIISTVYMAQYALYMTSLTRFITSQHSTHDIKAIISQLTLIISDSTPTVSLSSHPDYRSYNPHSMYDNTATICMTSYALHVTSHPQFRTSHLFIYDIRSTISDHTSTVSLSLNPPYRWYHSQYMCDLTSSRSVTSHPLYLWHNIH